MNRVRGRIQLCSDALTVASAELEFPAQPPCKTNHGPHVCNLPDSFSIRATCELHCDDGSRVHLQEQPSQVLAALLDRPGDVVTRDDLRDRLWKSDTFVDFEHGLNTAVKKLRQALGDSAEAPTFVETLPRRGYRFVAPVGAVPAAAAGSCGRFPTSRFRRSRRRTAPEPAAGAGSPLVVTALLVGACLACAAAPPCRLAQREAGARTTTQLAVMPFRVLARSRRGCRLPGHRHRRRHHHAAGGDPADRCPANIGGAAVRGVNCRSGRPGGSGGRSSISWSARYSRPVRPSASRCSWCGPTASRCGAHLRRTSSGTLLDLQDRLAEQVVAALRIELAGPDLARLHVRYTSNPDAYDHYLRGRSLLVNYTEANMRSAIQHFEQALIWIRIRPCPRRHRDRQRLVQRSVRAPGRGDHWAKRADEEAKRALALDGSLAEAHLASASAAGTAYGGYDWKTLLARTADALALDPSLEFAHLARMRGLLPSRLVRGGGSRRARGREVEPWSQRGIRSAGRRAAAVRRGVRQRRSSGPSRC